MVSREFGHRTGTVDLLDYDQGILEGTGAELNMEKLRYFLSLVDDKGQGIFVRPPGSDAPEEITEALVIFKQSEPVGVEFVLPSVLIIRDDFAPARERFWGPTEQYRVPAEGAQRISSGGCLGWSAYETKDRAHPYDLSYTIECWSRYRVVAQVLLQMIMARYPPNGKVTVVDSIACDRVYHVFQEGTADLTEINSLVDRVCGFSVSLRLEGELTLDRTKETSDAFLGATRPPNGSGGVPGAPTGPFHPDDPDPGAGGLYADGQPMKRVTAIGSDE